MLFDTLFRRKSPPAPSTRHADSPDAILRLLAERTSDVLISIDHAGTATYVSPAVERMLGYDPATIIGTDIVALIVDEDRRALIEAIARFEANGKEGELRHQSRFRRADGGVIWVEGSSSAGDVITGSIVLVLRDITDRKRLEDELATLALQDGLTGLANRRSFDQALDREWRRTVRDRTEISLLLLDLDHFKQFNDEYGHQAGDDCLRSVAAAIHSVVSRPGDLACRYGGEELAVILAGTNAAGAIEVGDRIRAAIEALHIPHHGNSAGPVVTASIGVATALARDGGTMRMPEGLLQAADHALYRAKNDGRNRLAQTLLFAPVDHG